MQEIKLYMCNVIKATEHSAKSTLYVYINHLFLTQGLAFTLASFFSLAMGL